MKYALPALCGLMLLTACAKPEEAPGNSQDTNLAASPSDTSAQRVAEAPANAAPMVAPSQDLSGQSASDPVYGPGAAEASPPPVMAREPDRATSRPRAETTPPIAQPSAPRAPLLAYEFRYGLVLPGDQVRPMMETHQEACERAGPTQCQVLGAESEDQAGDEATGRLTLRATPVWMRAFRGRLEADARDAHGRVDTAGTQGEDVSGLIDETTQAERSLAEQRADLKRRLARETRSDRAMELQQQLTQVEAQIAQTRVVRNDAEDRAAMSTVVVEYTSTGLAAASGPSAPLAEAARDFWAHMAAVFAVLLNVASFAAPFVLIGAPVWWLARRKAPVTPSQTPPSV